MPTNQEELQQMDFETFYTKWIPMNCPIHPFKKCVAVHLYLDKNKKLHNLAWIDKIDGLPVFNFIAHDKDLPDVKDIVEVKNKVPFVMVITH